VPDISEKISKGKENDYSPVNQYIDEQSRLRRARSFWINAKSWALIVVAIGILAVLLAWAYSLLNKHYILKRVAGAQKAAIEKKVNEAIGSGDFSKTKENLSKLEGDIKLLEENEKLEKENENLLDDKDNFTSQISDLEMKIESEKFIQENLKKTLEENFGDKVAGLESENLELLNETKNLKEKLKSNPENSELIKKIDELEKQGKGMGNLRYFAHKNVKLNKYDLTVKTRFHFEDVRKKPNKVECYINFGTPTLADLELGTEKTNFNVNTVYKNKGFSKKDFLNIKKKHCSWNYFN